VVFPDKGGGSGNSLANFVPTIARNWVQLQYSS
jgi:hypothetical protein